MNQEVASIYLDDIRQIFRQYKGLADRALAQIDDDDFFRYPDPDSNNLAILVKHMAGNLRSRWTDFLTADGEKPDRHRDTEFEITDEDSRQRLMAAWHDGWQTLFDQIDSLAADDLTRDVRIRGEAHSVMKAINRQVAHYSYHVGQIVMMAKQWRGADWQSLSIPKGRSGQFNATMSEKYGR